jgi:hypothetical protein
VNCNQVLCIEFLSALKFHREQKNPSTLQYYHDGISKMLHNLSSIPFTGC